MEPHDGPEEEPPAEEPRRPPTREEVRQRLRELMTRPARFQVVAALLLGLLGFAMVTQVHSTDRSNRYAGLRPSELVQVLNGLNAQSRRAEQEVTELQETRRRLTSRTQNREAALEQAREQSVTLGILAGTRKAQGTGVRITVNDPEGKVSLNTLLDGVEELRSGGAEAIELNDSVRVVAQTAFETDDGTLLAGGRRLAPPYVVDVIGNPDTLAKVLDIAGGFRFDVEAEDGTVKVEKQKRVRITSVVKAKDPREASPDDQ